MKGLSLHAFKSVGSVTQNESGFLDSELWFVGHGTHFLLNEWGSTWMNEAKDLESGFRDSRTTILRRTQTRNKYIYVYIYIYIYMYICKFKLQSNLNGLDVHRCSWRGMHLWTSKLFKYPWDRVESRVVKAKKSRVLSFFIFPLELRVEWWNLHNSTPTSKERIKKERNLLSFAFATLPSALLSLCVASRMWVRHRSVVKHSPLKVQLQKQERKIFFLFQTDSGYP